MENLGWEMALPSINLQYVPDEEELDKVKKMGQKLATIMK
jgi:flavorubredoxin